MNEQDLLALVRAAIEERRQVGPPKRADEPALARRVAQRRDVPADFAQHAGAGGAPPRRTAPYATVPEHASHGRFVLPAGAETDGPCLIEPAVACNHCGYCQSLGH